MSGEVTRRRNQRKGAPPPPKLSSSPKAESGGSPSGSAGCCVKLLFFFLLSTAAIISVAIYTDYQTGQLREAYVEFVPKEYRVTLEEGLGSLRKQADWTLNEGTLQYNAAKTYARTQLKGVNCGEKNCDAFLFGAEEDSITAQKAAKANADQDAKLKADKEAKLKAEKEAKRKAEKEAKLKVEKEAKLKSEKEAKLKAEKEAKLKAEKEAKLKAEQEAKLKAEKEAKVKAEKEAKLKTEKEAKLKAEQETKLKAEKEAKLKAEKEAKSKAEQEAKLKTEQEAKLKAEKEAKLKAEQEAKLKAEKEAKSKAEQETKLKAEKEAKLKAEQEAKLKAEQEAKLKADQEAKRKAEQEAKSKAEQEAKLRAEKEAKLKAEQEAKLKAEKEAKLKAEQEAKLKAEQEAKLKAEQEAKRKAEQEAKLKAEQAAKQGSQPEKSRPMPKQAKKSGSLDDPSEIRSKIQSTENDELERKRKLEKERLGSSKDTKSEKDRNEALHAAKKAAQLNSEPPLSNDDKRSLTSAEDARIGDELNSADSLLSVDPEAALLAFERILKEVSSSSPRALYGKGMALQKLAELRKSNADLEGSIRTLMSLLALGDDVPDALYHLAGEEAVRLLQFRGWNAKALSAMKLLSNRFPQKTSLIKDLGVLHLIMGQNEEAKRVFQGVLETDPEDGFALSHLGFVYKVLGDLETSVSLLKRGIDSAAKGAREGNFFFHLGDALGRLGRKEEADAVYKQGAELGVFNSFWQRSLYNLPNLKAQPIWTPEETGSAEALEDIRSQWKRIREEVLRVRNGSFAHESENLLASGRWKQFELFRQGFKVKSNCEATPFTCSLFEHFPPARTNTRGQVKFSLLSPGTVVHAHSGPTNTRLRVHLPLVVPEGADDSNLRLRVADSLHSWTEGNLLIFDDSFDHEVWNHSGGERLILIFDIWHPDISASVAASLPPI